MTDPTGKIAWFAVLAFIGKEAASEVVEQTTGVPMPTVKNAAKSLAFYKCLSFLIAC